MSTPPSQIEFLYNGLLTPRPLGLFMPLFLLLQGLFHQVIAQSGSAVTPWGFEDVAQHTYHAKRWASLVNCDKEDVREMIQCLKAVPSEELSSATGNYSVSSHFCTLSQKQNWQKL